MVQLNLLPDVKKEFLKAQRTKATVIGVSILVTLISVGLTALIAAIVYLVQPGIIALTQNQIDNHTEEIQNVEGLTKYLTLQNQLESLPGLHDQTVAYSRMFDFLKILNPAPPNNITLTSLQINNEEDTLTMSGLTSGFKSFSVFEDTLTNAEVTYTDTNGEKQTVPLFTEGGIAVQEQSLSNQDGQQLLSFSLLAAYNPEVFTPGISEIELTVPNIQTTKAITNAPDREVFEEEN